jgi:hypothetical protein
MTTPFTFKQNRPFTGPKADDVTLSGLLDKHGFCFYSPGKKTQSYSTDGGKALLSHLIDNNAAVLGPLFVQDSTLPKPLAPAVAFTTRLSRFFEVSNGAAATARPKENAQRFTAANRFPLITHSALTQHLPSYSSHANTHALESYIAEYLKTNDIPQLLWGEEFRNPKVRVLECIHTIKHDAVPIDLTPVCPVNPTKHELTTDAYTCHLAVTDIPFVPARGSHTRSVLNALSEHLTSCCSEADMRRSDVAFKLPYATGADGVDPLSIFEQQLAFTVPSGDLIICDTALSSVPLATICNALHATTQWACSFVITKPDPSGDSDATTPPNELEEPTSPKAPIRP